MPPHEKNVAVRTVAHLTNLIWEAWSILPNSIRSTMDAFVVSWKLQYDVLPKKSHRQACSMNVWHFDQSIEE
jgi:hypothetical protein